MASANANNCDLCYNCWTFVRFLELLQRGGSIGGRCNCDDYNNINIGLRLIFCCNAIANSNANNRHSCYNCLASVRFFETSIMRRFFNLIQAKVLVADDADVAHAFNE